jgi:8-oxo-dGTP pyrophosphatase MutT (NUDIX family)
MITLNDLNNAMCIESFDSQSAQKIMAPKPHTRLKQFADVPPKDASVLALLYPDSGALNIVLTRRQDNLRGHAGQISFPGGKRDPEDLTSEFTALRETHEEIGIIPDEIHIIGALANFYVPPSNFNISPFVGYIDYMPRFIPNPSEVAEIITFPVDELLSPDSKQNEYHDYDGMRVHIPYYDICGHKVWGATASILGELEQRLKVVTTVY